MFLPVLHNIAHFTTHQFQIKAARQNIAAMALTLNDLNDDVLIEVYKWLIAIASNDHPEVWDDDDNRLRRAEITSLSCVNVKFRRIAVPLLFSHVNFERTGYRSASEYEEFVSVFKGNGSLQSTVK